jgi:ubiquinone/menaquinone biosynthesis C-methylase UbiE
LTRKLRAETGRGGAVDMQEELTMSKQENSPVGSFVSGVILKSQFMRELFSQWVDYEKVFVKWLLNPMLESLAHEISRDFTEGALLDIGCGPGNLLFELHRLNPGIRVTGVDISKSKIRKAQRRMNGADPAKIRFLVNKTAELPFEEGLFHHAVSTFSFHIWDRPVELLNEIHRVLASGSTLVIYNFNGVETHARNNRDYFLKCIEKAPLFPRKIISREACYGYGHQGYHYYAPDEAYALFRKSVFRKAEIRTRAIRDSGDHFLMEARLSK